MNYKDNKKGSPVEFGNLKAGDVFIDPIDNTIHIKINQEEAFDICNDDIITYNIGHLVMKRKATLVLE